MESFIFCTNGISSCVYRIQRLFKTEIKKGENYEKRNRWKPCGSTHTHTHTIMSTKQSFQKWNRINTKDVKTTSLKIMFEKAREQYIVLRKMKLSGCDPQLYFAFKRIKKRVWYQIKEKYKKRADFEKEAIIFFKNYQKNIVKVKKFC